VSHLGLTGEWGFHKGNNDRIKITIGNSDNKKKYNLYYNDSRNFGNIYIYDNKKDLTDKSELLAPDALKSNFSDEDFLRMVKKYTEKSSKKVKSIFKVLMDQTAKVGLLSGLGNYLTPEILYRAKISPFREIGSLSNDDIKKLSHSIKYVTKLSYYNNTTGYMTNFGSFIKTHKEKIDDGKYPEYHPEIKLKEDTFKFNVYRQKKDPLGNEVERDVTINNGRTVY
jgi:formamidopyrimidine-DNA glycosylase